jgi:hypothetical protein
MPSKEIVRSLARWEAEPSRSKTERIIKVKWCLHQSGEEEDKKSCVGEWAWEGKGIVERKRKTILLELARARFLTLYLFFFINNRVRGLIVYITLC